MNLSVFFVFILYVTPPPRSSSSSPVNAHASTQESESSNAPSAGSAWWKSFLDPSGVLRLWSRATSALVRNKGDEETTSGSGDPADPAPAVDGSAKGQRDGEGEAKGMCLHAS